eukprot:scaffold69363_cov16-Prasinocladus_malaysianus.AAC.1
MKYIYDWIYPSIVLQRTGTYVSWRWVPQNQNEDTIVSRQWCQIDKTALKPAIILMRVTLPHSKLYGAIPTAYM